MSKALLGLLAAAAVATSRAGAATEFVTPEIVGGGAVSAAPRFAEARATTVPETDASPSASSEAAPSSAAPSVPADLGSNEPPPLRTPYTYENSAPAYRSTYYRYPWMHEPFGAKPMTLARVPIGAHVEFPWQKEAQEEYKDEALRRERALQEPVHGVPHPLAMEPAEGVPRWATSFPFAHPDATYPYYPTAHAAGVHPFGYYGSGASVLANAHAHAHWMAGGGPGPYGGSYLGGGLMDPRYSGMTPALLAATQQGQSFLPYGASWYGAGATDLI